MKKPDMKVLVIGSGGREHSLAWKIKQSPLVEKIYSIPGNAGTARIAENINIPLDYLNSVLSFADENKIDLTVVGPEDPLANGIVDLFRANNLKIFGPAKKAAQLESSKIFALEFMKRWGIPTGEVYAVTDNFNEAHQWAEDLFYPLVIKADGLAAGKGVYICKNKGDSGRAIKELLVDQLHGVAGQRIIFQEFLEGEEASFLVLTDGNEYRVLATSQDHKRVFDGDRGDNTGGMGAYSPAPVVDRSVNRIVLEKIVEPVIYGMKDEDNLFGGVLYAGLMIKNGQPKVVEFNCRFGDPETQPILMRMQSDLVPYLLACAEGDLSPLPEINWFSNPAVCVVMASGGYPGPYDKGYVIHGLHNIKKSKVYNLEVFHAGTKKDDDGSIYTAGGRVLGVTAMGKNFANAIKRAYDAVGKINFGGAHYRKDIGYRALNRE